MAASKKKKKASNSGLIATNKKAHRDFLISDKLEAGIELRGTEVKSIRLGKINLSDSYCRVEKGEAILHGCDIQPYEMASHTQHSAKRPRRLLLHKKEILKLAEAISQKGLTVLALRVYWKERRVKVEVGVGRGKTDRDQRQDIKKRIETREADREMARFNRKHG